MSDDRSIVLISASDTDLLAARASGAPWRLANPARTAPDQVPGLVAGSYCVIVRLLGGRRSWPEGLAAEGLLPPSRRTITQNEPATRPGTSSGAVRAGLARRHRAPLARAASRSVSDADISAMTGVPPCGASPSRAAGRPRRAGASLMALPVG